jgi:fatty acid desaturase
MMCVAAGGYVTAWLARRAEIRHAVIMGAIEVALTIWAMIELPDQAPMWAWILGMVLIVPAAWVGGAIRAKQTRPRHPSERREQCLAAGGRRAVLPVAKNDSVPAG